MNTGSRARSQVCGALCILVFEEDVVAVDDAVEVAEQLVADRSEQRCPHKQRPSEDLIRCARRHGVAEPSKVGVDGSWYGRGRHPVAGDRAAVDERIVVRVLECPLH